MKNIKKVLFIIIFTIALVIILLTIFNLLRNKSDNKMQDTLNVYKWENNVPNELKNVLTDRRQIYQMNLSNKRAKLIFSLDRFNDAKMETIHSAEFNLENSEQNFLSLMNENNNSITINLNGNKEVFEFNNYFRKNDSIRINYLSGTRTIAEPIYLIAMSNTPDYIDVDKLYNDMKGQNNTNKYLVLKLEVHQE